MKISLDEFKKQVLVDYKNAIKCSQSISDMPLEKKNLVTMDCDVAQIALSKSVEENDSYFPSKIDLAYYISKNTKPQKEFSAIEALNKAREVKKINNKSIVVYTTSERIFDSIYDAIVYKLPIAFVIWNTIINDRLLFSNSDLLKLYSGFTNVFKNNMSIMAVKGNDYPTLCISFEKQLAYTRNNCKPSITIVEGDNQSILCFKQWIIDRQLYTENDLD